MTLQNAINNFKSYVCRVYNSADVVIPADSTGSYPIPFDGTKFDNSPGSVMHSNSVNNSRIFAPVSGYYAGWVGLQISNAGSVLIFLIGGVGASRMAVQNSSAGAYLSMHSGIWYFNKGEYFEVQVRAYTNPATLTRTSPFALEATLQLVA